MILWLPGERERSAGTARAIVPAVRMAAIGAQKAGNRHREKLSGARGLVGRLLRSHLTQRDQAAAAE
jgi:hypothetical protein